MKKLTDSNRYRGFVNKRDSALEKYLLKTRSKIGDNLRNLMALVQIEINRTYPLLNTEFLDPATRMAMRHVDDAIDKHAQIIALEITQNWLTMRYVVSAIAQAAEQQAIIQTIDGEPQKISSEELKGETFNNLMIGGSVHDRVQYSLNRLRRKIMDAMEMARIMGAPLPEATERILKAFPNLEIVKKPKVLARVKEAAGERKGKEFFGSDFFIDDFEWEEILSEYKSEYIPRWRDPRYELDIPVAVGTSEEFATYAWELERDLTSDFVDKVRSGENEAAKKNGITQFVWIAINGPHGKTKELACDYCNKRDGLTTKEIKAKLKDDWKDDPEWSKKYAIPLHPNCWCRLAPATDALPEMPESNEAEFLDWLNS